MSVTLRALGFLVACVGAGLFAAGAALTPPSPEFASGFLVLQAGLCAGVAAFIAPYLWAA